MIVRLLGMIADGHCEPLGFREMARMLRIREVVAGFGAQRSSTTLRQRSIVGQVGIEEHTRGTNHVYPQQQHDLVGRYASCKVFQMVFPGVAG